MCSTAPCHACHPLAEGEDAQARSPPTPLLLLQQSGGLRGGERPVGDVPAPSLWRPPPGAGGLSVFPREARFSWAALATATLPTLTEAWPLFEGAASGT